MKTIPTVLLGFCLFAQTAVAANPAQKQFQAEAKKQAADLRATGEPKDRCSLGATFADYGIVSSASAGSQLQPGDKIETLDGVSIGAMSYQQLSGLLRSKAPNAVVKLSIKRGGVARSLDVACANAKDVIAPYLLSLDAAAKGDFKECLQYLQGAEALGQIYWGMRMGCAAHGSKLDPGAEAQLTYDWLVSAINEARYVAARRPQLIEWLHKTEPSFRAANRPDLHEQLVALSKAWPGAAATAYASAAPNWSQFRVNAEAAVRAKLIDPDSAQFEWPAGFLYGTWKPAFSKHTFEGYWTCGLVNAKNRMGGYTGKSSFVVVMANESTVKWTEVSSGRDYDFTDAACAKSLKLLPPPPSTMQLAAPAPVSSVADEIEKLASLRDKGIITQQEFEAQKAKLLGK